MASIARGVKASAGGGTSFVANTDALAAEVEFDFATIYGDYNGNVNNANIAAAAAIETSKIDGLGDSIFEFRTETSPGVSGSESFSTNLSDELSRLRFKQKELGLGTSTVRNTTASGDDVFWFDTPMVGPNLLRNANFAVKTTAAGSAPDGWVLVGTPGTCTTTTTGVTEGPTNMRAIRIAAAGAANEGISQTLAGLKANKKYVVGCRAKVNAGGDIFSLTTTGASGATFGNLNLTTSSTTYVTLAGVIVTDATPTNIVVQLLAVADGDSVDVTHCWVRECDTDRLPLSNTAWASQTITGDTAGHYALTTETDSGLSVAVVPPGPGYTIEVAAKLDVQNDSGSGAASAVFLLKENGTEVDNVYLWTLDNAANRDKATVRFSYVNTAPVAGTTYTYTVTGFAISGALDRNGAAYALGETPRSWIRCRAVLESAT